MNCSGEQNCNKKQTNKQKTEAKNTPLKKRQHLPAQNSFLSFCLVSVNLLSVQSVTTVMVSVSLQSGIVLLSVQSVTTVMVSVSLQSGIVPLSALSVCHHCCGFCLPPVRDCSSLSLWSLQLWFLSPFSPVLFLSQSSLSPLLWFLSPSSPVLFLSQSLVTTVVVSVSLQSGIVPLSVFGHYSYGFCLLSVRYCSFLSPVSGHHSYGFCCPSVRYCSSLSPVSGHHSYGFCLPSVRYCSSLSLWSPQLWFLSPFSPVLFLSQSSLSVTAVVVSVSLQSGIVPLSVQSVCHHCCGFCLPPVRDCSSLCQ